MLEWLQSTRTQFLATFLPSAVFTAQATLSCNGSKHGDGLQWGPKLDETTSMPPSPPHSSLVQTRRHCFDNSLYLGRHACMPAILFRSTVTGSTTGFLPRLFLVSKDGHVRVFILARRECGVWELLGKMWRVLLVVRLAWSFLGHPSSHHELVGMMGEWVGSISTSPPWGETIHGVHATRGGSHCAPWHQQPFDTFEVLSF